MTGRAAPAVRAHATGVALPRHVAVIMDGNGRWAKRRLLPRIAGHRRGIDAVRAVSRSARDRGIEVLTLYAFSSENWKRPADEIADLMGLLRRFIRTDIDEIDATNTRLQIIGDYRAFASDLVELIDEAVARTARNTGSVLCIGLNYGSHDEIVRAVRHLAASHDLTQLDATTLGQALDTHDLPAVDLLIRTSGEQRLSNFMLWQAAYAELLFVETLWPDFGAAELDAALEQFGLRERRFGGR